MSQQTEHDEIKLDRVGNPSGWLSWIRFFLAVVFTVGLTTFFYGIGFWIVEANSDLYPILNDNKFIPLFAIGMFLASALAGFYLGNWLVYRHIRGALWTTSTLLVVILAVWLGWWWVGSSRHERELNKWRKVVASVKTEQQGNVPPEQNAALIYKQVRELGKFTIVSKKNGQWQVTAVNKDDGSAKLQQIGIQEVDKILRTEELLRRLVHRTGRLKHVDWSVVEDAYEV